MSPPAVAVVLALYQPDMAALERQLTSVLGQQDCRVNVHLFADGPMLQLDKVRELIEAMPDVSLTCFPENRGPAATFIEGLAAVLGQSAGAEPRCYAFCDQDDVWHPGKLASSLGLLVAKGSCAHGDATVVDAQLQVIHPSLFALERREAKPGIIDLFFRNNATGMTMVFDEELARQVVRLAPLRPQGWLHDHFTAFLATCSGGLAWLDRPVADYVQHAGNVVGAGRAGFRLPSGGFLNPRGEAARLVVQGEALVRALLTQPDLTAVSRSELEVLLRLLSGRSLASLPQALAVLRRIPGIPRRLLARLLWARVAG